MKIIITCEHGGNHIPALYENLFKDQQAELNSHAGLDIGALGLAQVFAAKYADEFFYAEESRLLVELNRSAHHKQLFSKITDQLPAENKQILLAEYYFPYRNQIFEAIKKMVAQDNIVLHLSVHSFTPILLENVRKTDVGFLYDPKRNFEKQFCKKWKKNFQQLSDDFRVRFNYPYLGISDGLVTALRKAFSSQSYIGMELEVNQKIVSDIAKFDQLTTVLLSSFGQAVDEFECSIK